MDLAPEVKDVFYGSVQELNRRVLPNLTYDPLASYDLATYQEGMYGSLITDLRSKCVSTGQKIYCLMWLYILVMLLILLLVVLIVICCFTYTLFIVIVFRLHISCLLSHFTPLP